MITLLLHHLLYKFHSSMSLVTYHLTHTFFSSFSCVSNVSIVKLMRWWTKIFIVFIWWYNIMLFYLLSIRWWSVMSCRLLNIIVSHNMKSHWICVLQVNIKEDQVHDMIIGNMWRRCMSYYYTICFKRKFRTSFGSILWGMLILFCEGVFVLLSYNFLNRFCELKTI
jgi:hypothetical protein